MCKGWGGMSFPTLGIETGPQNAMPKVKILIDLGKGLDSQAENRDWSNHQHPRPPTPPRSVFTAGSQGRQW